MQLFEFFQRTGDRKYLEPVSRALAWLESARIPGAEGFTHTCFYEMETNRPIYIRQTGTTVQDVRFEPTYEEEGAYPYAVRLTISVDSLRKEYDRLTVQSPAEARADYARHTSKRSLPHYVRGGYLATALGDTQQTDAGVADIIAALDDRGGWRDQVSLLDPFQPFTTPRREVTAYTVGGYIARMYRLINWLDLHAP